MDFGLWFQFVLLFRVSSYSSLLFIALFTTTKFNFFFLFDLETTCGSTPLIPFAFEIDRNFVGSSSIVGSFVEFSCRLPYILQDAARIECLANGTWSQPWPRCTVTRSGRSCGLVPQVANAVVTSTLSSTSAMSTTGDQASYSCKAGFTLRGPVFSICQSNGAWTPLPECVQSSVQ